jgi:hypothetical protein
MYEEHTERERERERKREKERERERVKTASALHALNHLMTLVYHHLESNVLRQTRNNIFIGI